MGHPTFKSKRQWLQAFYHQKYRVRVGFAIWFKVRFKDRNRVRCSSWSRVEVEDSARLGL